MRVSDRLHHGADQNNIDPTFVAPLSAASAAAPPTTPTPTYEWKGGNGSFSNALQWDLSTNKKVHAVPGPSDNADFAKGGTVSGDGSVNQITIEAKVTFTGDISASSTVVGVVVTGGLTLDSGAVLTTTDIATGGGASLNFKAGSTVNAGAGENGLNAGDVGVNIGGGRATITDATINSSGLIAIGNSDDGISGAGTATCIVSDGAHVTASYTGIAGAGDITSTDTDKGTLTLTGAGTVWSNTGTSGPGAQGAMLVGITGHAALNIEAGAVLNDATFGDIASESGSVGDAKITGDGSAWNNTEGMYVGDGGTGKLTISDGGTVTSAGATIGDQAGSSGQVTITGAGSNWQDSQYLTVGYGGNGTIKLEDGASMAVGTDLNLSEGAAVLLGYEAGTEGKLTVTDATLSVNGQIDIGLDGKGVMTIEDGATVTSGDATGENAVGIVVGFDSGGGTLIVSGSGTSLQNDGYLTVANGGLIEIKDGASVTSTINQSLGYDGCDIGYSGSNKLEVTGTGSKLSIASQMVVGFSGTGILDISSGGSVGLGAAINEATGDSLFVGLDSKTKGTVSVTGAGSHLTVTGQADIGLAGSGKLEIGAGATVTTGDFTNDTAAGLTLGFDKGGSGLVSVTGAGASLTNNGEFLIGISGRGTLDISGGGTVSTSIASTLLTDGVDMGYETGSGGTATVQSAGSAWHIGSNLVVGVSGDGMLIDTDEALVAVGTSLVIGEFDHAKGNVAVQGEALLTAAQETTLGDQKGASGTLTVSDGATIGGKLVQSEFAYGAQLVVGYEGIGLLDVDLGGLVTPLSGGSGEIDVGLGRGGNGTIIVDGAGSELKGASLTLGASSSGGTASVTVSNGGSISLSGEVLAYHHATITLEGGTLSAAEISFLGGTASGFGVLQAPSIEGGTITATGGTLDLTGDVSGRALLGVDNDSTLMLGGSVAKTAGLIFNGTTDETLALAAPQSVAGAISDFVQGDLIDLLNVTITQKSYTPNGTGGTLSLTLSNGDHAKLTFVGANTLNSFTFNTDNHGGTLIGHT